jgi:hypothetical protein
MRPLRLAAVCALAAMLPGCATTTHDTFAALSSQRVPYLGYQIDEGTLVPDVAAEIRTQTILWIPTNTRPPTLQAAVDAALKRGRGEILLNAEVDHWWVFVPFLYGQEGWYVRGDSVRSRRPEFVPPPATEPPAPGAE